MIEAHRWDSLLTCEGCGEGAVVSRGEGGGGGVGNVARCGVGSVNGSVGAQGEGLSVLEWVPEV